jgi:hypothetical protein
MSPGGVRVFALARQIGVAAAAVLAAGRILAIGVRTPLSAVSAEGRELLEGYFKDIVRSQTAGGVTAARPTWRSGAYTDRGATALR